MTTTASDRSVRHFLSQFGNDLFRVDGRVVSAARQVLFQPGRLENEIVGRSEQGLASIDPLRAPIHPVRFYLLVNVLFFFAVPWVNSEYGTIWSMTAEALQTLWPGYPALLAEQAAVLGLELPVYQLLFDRQMQSIQGAFVAIMIPQFAVLLWLALRHRRRWFVDHLLIATSGYSAFLVSLLVFGVVARLCTLWLRQGALVAILIAIFVWFAALTIWHARMLRCFYGLSGLRSAWLATISWTAMMLPTWIYMHVLFWATLLSLSSG